METIRLKDKILGGYLINKKEAMALLNRPLNELTQAADEIRHHFCKDAFDMCTIINGKSGMCEEDCKYCAQSAHYKTQVEVFPLVKGNKVLEDAIAHEKQGIKRYSIVTSGKKASAKDLESLCGIYKTLKGACQIKLCASHGLLDEKALRQLKASGVVRYHNNLETSRKHFAKICTTHTYDEKIATIKAAQRAGLEVCSGGIIGLGESDEDRMDMAFELRDLKIQSIPLNLLNPIEGTPLGQVAPVSEAHFIKIAAIYRFIHPQAVIRLAGGRDKMEAFGKKAFQSGVNGTISGDLLTTYGNKTSEDIKMIQSLGYDI